MEKTYLITVKGEKQPFSCKPKQSLLEALTENGIVLTADCSGRGSCGKCKIEVLSGKIATLNGAEKTAEDDNTYLACTSYPGGDIVLRISELAADNKGKEAEIKNYAYLADEPIAVKREVKFVFPTIDHNFALQQMLEKALAKPGVRVERLDVLRNFAALLSENKDVLTAILLGDEVIDIEDAPGNTPLWGVAFDIGTTTVAGMLVDLKNKKVVASHSKTNPQTSFGADVISRIHSAGVNDGLALQAEAIRRCLNQIIEILCKKADINSNNIYAACMVGNATMTHLLLNILPTSLAKLPYAQVVKNLPPFKASEIGLELNPNAGAIVLPNINSHVGSDTTAAIVAINQDISPIPQLLVDLGTNGEMALSNGKDIYVCSTAAGPAFEGTHLKNGMRAFKGAIAEVKIADGEVFLKVIGDISPLGICGSGVVMAVAELLKAKVISPSGRFNKPSSLPPLLRERLKKGENNEWFFTLYQAQSEMDSTKDICLTQGDIRQIQLVKSSILTGIEFLMEKMPDIEKFDVSLAGAFGNYIDIDSAMTIGLLPERKINNIRSVGNAAGIGAVEALLSTDKFERCFTISKLTKYVELASHPDFQNRFLKNLSFS